MQVTIEGITSTSGQAAWVLGGAGPWDIALHEVLLGLWAEIDTGHLTLMHQEQVLPEANFCGDFVNGQKPAGEWHVVGGRIGWIVGWSSECRAG